MSLDNISMFKALSQKMEWLSQRQEVIANNVANADTPGFIPSDIKKFNFEQALRNTGSGVETPVLRTDDKHLDFIRFEKGQSREFEQEFTYETSPDGNGVVIEEQMLKASQTAAEYQTTVNLYKKQYDMMLSVLRAQ